MHQVPRLPKVSVILCFFNEEWFALLRSVWGVILTSPPELVDEILLVDDGSTMHHLHDLLDEYVSEEFRSLGQLTALSLMVDGHRNYCVAVIVMKFCAVDWNRNYSVIVIAQKIQCCLH